MHGHDLPNAHSSASWSLSLGMLSCVLLWGVMPKALSSSVPRSTLHMHMALKQKNINGGKS